MNDAPHTPVDGADGEPTPLRRRPWTATAAPLLLAAVLIGVLLSVVAREQTLYYWDELTYWLPVVGLAELLQHHPVDALGAVSRSLRTNEYNLLPAVGPAVVCIFTGPGRVAYVGALSGLYLLPAVLAWGWLGRRAGATTAGAATLFAAPLLLSPDLWTPLLGGYPDVGGLALAAGACGIYFGLTTTTTTTTTPTDGRAAGVPVPLDRPRVVRLVALGVTLAVLVLFRRWYSFWVAGFMATAFVATWARGGRAAGLVDAVRSVGLIGVAAAVTAAVLSWPTPLRIVTTDYNTMYAAYREQGGYAASVAKSAANVAQQFGVLPLAACGVAIAAGLADRRLRGRVGFVLGVGAIAFLMFNRTNVLGTGQHHLYLLFLTLLWPVSLWVTRPERSRTRGLIKTVAVVGLCAANFGYAFVRPAGAVPTLPLLSGLRLQPAVRDDLEAVATLLGRLGECVGPGESIYVLSSSPALNYSQLRGATLSLGREVPAAAHVGYSAEVDLRDGFPVGLLRANFVVVADPVQYHLRPADQQVIGIPAADFLNGGPFSAAFTRWPQTVTLQHGITAVVFERTRLTTVTDAQGLLRQLQAAHPDHAGVFRLPPP